MTTATTKKTIESVMTRDPVRVPGAMTAAELAVILEENEVSGAPVVDVQDRVIGVVSRTDLLRRCVEGPLGPDGTSLASIAAGEGNMLDTDALGTVTEFMNSDPVTALPDTSIATIARRMVTDRIHRIIIVDDQKHVLGIVTSLDLVALLH